MYAYTYTFLDLLLGVLLIQLRFFTFESLKNEDFTCTSPHTQTGIFNFLVYQVKIYEVKNSEFQCDWIDFDTGTQFQGSKDLEIFILWREKVTLVFETTFFHDF